MNCVDENTIVDPKGCVYRSGPHAGFVFVKVAEPSSRFSG
jgi:hypothetical protein